MRLRAAKIFLLVASLAALLVPGVASAAAFSDVTAATPHHEDISWLAETRISEGWEDDGSRVFRGMSPVVRQDMAAFLHRLADHEGASFDESEELEFSDVSESTPHFRDILWLAATGISEGWEEKDGSHTFRGMSEIVRQDMAAFLYRLAGSPEYEPSPDDMMYFDDVDESTPHYREVLWLYSTGVSEGWEEKDGTHTFRGMDTVKRQDMAAFLHRMSERGLVGPDEEVAPPELILYADETSDHQNGTTWRVSASNKIASATSSNPSAVRVSVTGDRTIELSAVGSGSATITITDTYGQSVDHTVRVYTPELKFTSLVESAMPGDSIRLGVSNPLALVSSSDESVATATIGSDIIIVEVACRAEGTTTITVTDVYGQRAEYDLSVSYPELTLNPSRLPNCEPGFLAELTASNEVAAVSSSDERIATAEKGPSSRSATVLCREPGTATITVKDVYGQTETLEVSVSERLYYLDTGSGSSPVVVETSRYDDSLYIPSIAYNDTDLIYCDGTPGENGYPDAFEAALCSQENFGTHYSTGYETSDWNGRGYVRLWPSAEGNSVYYVRVRSFNVEGTEKVYGPWSEACRIEVPNFRVERDGEAAYDYELYFIDQTTGADIYSGYVKGLYIKTDNPDGSSIRLTKTDGSEEWSYGFLNIEYSDVGYHIPYDADMNLRKVDGGYFMPLTFKDPGTYDLQIREANSGGYVVAREFTWDVIDTTAAKREWMQGIIDEVTTSGMSPFEKMSAVCGYLIEPGRFTYITNVDGNRVELIAEPNNPFFRSYRWNSYTSPAALTSFAELIGGFDKINNMYDDYPSGSSEWNTWHSFVELTVDGETRRYSVCPLTGSGEVGEITMVNFSDTSTLIPAA